jgi:hypothetical protein
VRAAKFERPQTAMVFGDAEAVLNGLLSELRSMGVGKVKVQCLLSAPKVAPWRYSGRVVS